jgi:hypothetical protein
MKVIYALWGQSLETTLLAPSWHNTLQRAGATRLHVNVDDADVAAAKLRITTFAAPVSAVVTAWLDAEPADLSRAVTGISERCAGWEVEERTPLIPPDTAPGQRTPGLAQIAFLRIPADLDEAEWRHRWQDLHTTVAVETQATFGYTQNRVLRPILGDERVDAIVEELFPMAAMTSLHAFYGSGGDDAELGRRLDRMMKSVSSFGADRDLDSVPTSRYVFDLPA